MKSPNLRCVLLVIALAWMSTLTSHAGWIKRYVYNNINGVLVTNLFGTNISGVVVFPGSPDTVEVLPQASSGPFDAEFPNSFYENWGSWTPGYIEPPETGSYIFWVYGDDETQLWITTDGSDPLNPAKKQLISSVPGFTSIRQWDKYPEQQSAPVPLEKGKRYYLEILHKDGTGGDALGLGWQLPSGKQERPLQTFYLQPTHVGTDPIVVNGPYAAPITPASPNDVNIYDGQQAVIYADVNLAPPYTVAWIRGAADIPGETQTYYRFRARNSDNGAQFSVRVNGTVYGPLSLTVQADSLLPSLVSATVAPSNPTQIRVLFSEEVTAASATSLANYVLSSGAVQSAQLQTDGRTVILQTGLLSPGVLHLLTINGIQDMALPANTIPNTQTNIVVAEGAISFRFWDKIFATDLATLRTWTSNNPPAPSYLTNGFNEERTITNTTYQWNLNPTRDNYMGQMIGYLTAPETGLYKFAIASDDHSILYLGTSDQRSSKREICNFNGSTAQWNVGAQLGNQQSSLIFLEAGQRYYLEAVYRDGTGGDGVSVFWQTPSGPPLPTANVSVQATTQPFLIPANYLATFATPPVQGALSFRIWYSSFATDLMSLRIWSGNPNYVNDVVTETRAIATTTYGWPLIPMTDNYAGQMIGYITAPETGNYRFGIASDDHSILYLGTNDLRSSKREICNFNGSTGQWNLGAQANQLSGDIALVAGQRYYIEAVYRDGTGGDGVTVAWYTPSMLAAGSPFPPSPANNQAATTPYLIPANYLSAYSPNLFGNVTLTANLPASFSAPESTRPTLSVVAAGSVPYAYQWYRGAAPIAGATASSYTLPYVRPADGGATFYVIVTNNFSSVTSVVATLTVTTDSTKPAVASVGSLFKQTIEVRLSEPVTPLTAANTANYILLNSGGTPVAVSSAVQDVNDGAHITLQTAVLPETDLMRLAVQNLADLSAAANVMNPATNTFRANNFDALERINNPQAYSATAVGDQILMTAGGGDIWDAADRCAFLYKTTTGNFDYKIQGISLQTINQWCKMGIMVRPSTTAGARNAFVAFTPLAPSQNTYTPQIRDATGGSSTSSDVAGTLLNLGLQGGVVARPTVTYPSWVRLQRIGDVFYWYYGTTGTNWTFWTYYDPAVSSPEGALPATLQLGLAITSHDTARTVDGVMASFTAVNDGPLYLTLQPTNTTVVEGGTTSFAAAAAGSTPIFYQWLKNTTPIPNATNATMVLTRVPFADNAAQIACRISNPYGQVVTTTNALLTVTQDGVLPTVRYYLTPKVNLNPIEVKLIYSEPMDPVSAQNTANYQITTSPGGTPLGVSAAVLDVDERTVILTTATQTPGTLYKVVVNNVKDLACCPANTIAPNSTDYFFYSGSAPQYAQRADGYIIMEAENAQEVVTASDGDVFLLTNSSAGFSGSGYMFVPNGRGTGGTGGTGTALFGTGAALVFHVRMNQIGRHIIWVRGWNQDPVNAGNDDSIYLGFNDAVGIGDPSTDLMVGMNTDVNQSQLTGWGAAGWAWRSDRSAGTDPLTFTNTTTGLHRLIIWAREDGTLVDKIVIEAGNRAAGNTAAPAPATANNNLGEPETWDFLVAPPGPPTNFISSPLNGQTLPVGIVQITSTASGSAPIALVEFFQGTNLIGTATSSPYTINWASVPEGIYSLTARVTDVLGNQATSAAVKIVVGDALTLTDVTTPGDPISILNGSSPAAETVTNAINDTTSKYLNNDADAAAPFVGPVGFVVTPSKGPSVVSRLRLYTANDNEIRDPMDYVLEGSNDGSSWSLISSNLLTLPSGRNAAGQALNPLTQNVWHVAFANTATYSSYRLRFFNVKGNATATSMQLGEVELLGTVVAPPGLSISAGTGGSFTITASQPGSLLSATNLTAPVFWTVEGPISGTVTITPTSDVPAKYYRLRVP